MNNTFMKTAIFSCLLLILVSCGQVKDLSLTITNPSSFDRAEELVEVSLRDIEEKIKLKEGEVYVVRNADGVVVPSQITSDNKLLFQTGLKANSTANFSINKTNDTLNFTSKAYANFHPERFDDLAWENDRVGFRLYGEALESVQASTSGMDLWYKRTNEIVLDEWYRKETSKEASYHVDHGEGCDPYAVGRSLGGGSMAPFINEAIYLNDNYLSYEIIDNGPLRTTFKLKYPDIRMGEKSMSETRTISLDAGAQLTKITQEYSTKESLTVVAGFSKRADKDSILYISGQDYFLYEEPVTEKNGQIFLGLVIPQGIEKVSIGDSIFNKESQQTKAGLANVLASTTYTPNKPITYYTGFGWSKFGFDDVSVFQTYIEQFSQSLKKPFIINIK